MISISRVLMLPVFVAGCVQNLPPRPVPPATAPKLEPAPPPPEGQARLVVDVVDGRMPVQRVRLAPQPVDQGGHHFRFDETPEPLCAPSPCAVDLPFGNILLGFPRIGQPDVTEVEVVHVGPESSVYRRSLSIYDGRTGAVRILGIIATSLGGASAITGTALLPIGISDGNNGLTTAGAITLGGGALLMAIGIWAIRADSPTYTPGSSNHFALP
jgi:hypothetical protein